MEFKTNYDTNETILYLHEDVIKTGIITKVIAEYEDDYSKKTLKISYNIKYSKEYKYRTGYDYNYGILENKIGRSKSELLAKL